MSERKVSWRDRYPDEVTCVRCLEVYDQVQLDRMLWCERCRRRARDRASWYGWVGGLAFAAACGAYVWFVIEPTDLVPGGWLATLVAAAWIGQKVAREMIYGAMRFTNARATEAVPPKLEDDGGRDAAGGDASG
ncbi:MAG: hypothetical protein AMS19_12270 [Gemmatimonas sp. SG8_23]|nr:MAG: hypothetical protein AMS19_12270 [Gemmatimonas sp. SG8_23]